MARPNAHQREARQRRREIVAYSETPTSRAATPTTAAATASAGGIDVGGNWQRYGRVDIDPISTFLVAE